MSGAKHAIKDLNPFKKKQQPPPGYVYRWDNRPPNQVMAEGFQPQNPAANLPLKDHVLKLGDNQGQSNWVSTSEWQGTSSHVGAGSQNLYKIDTSHLNPNNLVNVNQKLGPHQYAHQQEWAHNGAIPPDAVVGQADKIDAWPKILGNNEEFGRPPAVNESEIGWRPLDRRPSYVAPPSPAHAPLDSDAINPQPL
jgi:hypothetical protein